MSEPDQPDPAEPGRIHDVPVYPEHDPYPGRASADEWPEQPFEGVVLFDESRAVG